MPYAGNEGAESRDSVEKIPAKKIMSVLALVTAVGNTYMIICFNRASSVDGKLILFFLLIPENRRLHFKRLRHFSEGDNLHEISKPIFWKTINGSNIFETMELYSRHG